jgi:two-component system, cell cycle response regulator
MPRLTHRGFTDLAIFMVGFGFFMGVIFPPFVVVLGMPQANAFTLVFGGSCIAAGLCVGAINWILARQIVGRQLVILSNRMNEVSLEVEKVSQADDWWHANSDRWLIEAESEDILGQPALAFNRLAQALARSLRYEKAGRSFAEILVNALNLDSLSRAALECLLLETHAPGGAIVSRVDSGVYVLAMEGLESVRDVQRCELVAQALESGESAGKTGECHAKLADGKTEVREIYAAPFLYGGEVRGAMLLAESGTIDTYARSIADLFARDFGLAVATLIERYVRRADESNRREAEDQADRAAIPVVADVPAPGAFAG